MDINEIVSMKWPDWKVGRFLGAGSYGNVYELIRRDSLVSQKKCAVKMVYIPRNEEELRRVRSQGGSKKELRTWLENQVHELSAEIALMEKVEGNTNVVNIKDSTYVELPELPQFIVLIRMEMLTPLMDLIEMHPFSEAEVILLGMDLCAALTICHGNNIVHRDIKPANIFVDDLGNFKLGDFGVARTMERTTNAFTRAGTYDYMSPEIFNNQVDVMDMDTAKKVDIYSLGMVMYILLNNMRIPFVPLEGIPSGELASIAFRERMKGKALPDPVNASPELSRIIRKACEYDPNDRYPNARTLRRDLKQLLASHPELNMGRENIIARIRQIARRPEGYPALEPKKPRSRQNSQNKTERIAPHNNRAPAASGQKPGNPYDAGHQPGFPIWKGVALVLVLIGVIGAGLLGYRELGKRASRPEPTEAQPITITMAPETMLASETTITPAPTPTTTPTPSATPTPMPTATPSPEIVEFHDKRVEKAALDSLQKAAGPVYRDELAGIEELYLGQTGLTDLTDLEQFPNLKKLYLNQNGLVDISGLSRLTGLEGLEISGNQIQDISALSGLTNLKTLSFTYNDVADLSPLQGLGKLKTLLLMGNPRVEDISPLAHLSNLKRLDIYGNPGITDLSPLQGLKSLEQYAGPEWPWAAETDRAILGVFRENDEEVMLEAFNQALDRVGVQHHVGMRLSRSYSQQAWKYLLESATQSRTADAICLLPYAGGDYAEAMAKAVQNGRALHMLSAETPADLFDEICALYGRTDIENPYR